MKTNPIFFILLLSFSAAFSQSWQWGKRGGSSDELYENPTTGVRAEEAYSIVTDSNKNIYMLSHVGGSNLNFDGVADSNYEPSSSNSDLAIVSFACDGTFRWSKIIGGSGIEMFTNIQIDNQDNIYLAGSFGNISTTTDQQHIDDDVTIPAIPPDYRRLVIFKIQHCGTTVVVSAA